MNLPATQLPTTYSPMLASIDAHLPAIARNSEAFNKSSSQFKAATLDVVDLTPINSAKHLLAVIQRTRQALEEASITLRRKQLKRAKKEQQLMSASGVKVDRLMIDIDELTTRIENTEASCRGAVRKLANAINQYQNILDALGKTHLTEQDYENDQARYHLMTAFNQALTAARARGGLIDEGNHIYLMQLGVNGAVAQAEVTALLHAESELLASGKAPTHAMVINWLHALADRFHTAPTDYAAQRGMATFDPSTILVLESHND